MGQAAWARQLDMPLQHSVGRETKPFRESVPLVEELDEVIAQYHRAQAPHSDQILL